MKQELERIIGDLEDVRAEVLQGIRRAHSDAHNVADVSTTSAALHLERAITLADAERIATEAVHKLREILPKAHAPGETATTSGGIEDRSPESLTPHDEELYRRLGEFVHDVAAAMEMPDRPVAWVPTGDYRADLLRRVKQARKDQRHLANFKRELGRMHLTSDTATEVRRILQKTDES